MQERENQILLNALQQSVFFINLSPRGVNLSHCGVLVENDEGKNMASG